MEITVLVCEIGNEDRSWKETYNNVNTSDPEKGAQGIIDNFNNTLRPNERPRKILKFLDHEGGKVYPHDWGKVSLVTEIGGYDRMECNVCGITGKRHGLGQNGVEPDKKYNADLYKQCNTSFAHRRKWGLVKRKRTRKV